MVTRRIGTAGAGCLLAAAALAGCSSGGGVQTTLGTQSAAPATSAEATSASPGAAASTSSSAAAGSGDVSASSIPSAIPAAAWIRPSAIPLYATYHWPSPASTAKSAKAPALSAVQDCQLTLSSSDQAELGAFPAAQAELSPTSGGNGGQDDWSAVETVLATNDTSSGDIQGIFSLYTDLVADLGKCAASGAKVSVAVNQGPGYAATITIPTSTGSTLTWHEYLTAPYGYLIELAVYVAPYSGDRPGATWDGTSASSVLSALQSGPCSITKLC